MCACVRSSEGKRGEFKFGDFGEEGAGFDGRVAEGAFAGNEEREPEGGVAKLKQDIEGGVAVGEEGEERVGRGAGKMFGGKNEAKREPTKELDGFVGGGDAGAARVGCFSEEGIEDGGFADDEEVRDGVSEGVGVSGRGARPTAGGARGWKGGMDGGGFDGGGFYG